jgi:tetratricopeptide (TPR) repeat protein
VYDAGLQKFPNSGKLYLEKGNIHWIKKEYVKALPYYEKGIEVDPSFSSNYFRAAILYFNSTEEVRGLIYGELFMNLERNSSRTAEMSEMLYDTYKSEIKISEDSINIDFCNIVMNAEDIASKEKIRFPFCMVFGQAFIMALGDVNSIDIGSLDKVRSAFVKNYFKMGHNKTHPIVLYDYQNKMLELGHLEAYNHWILSKGDEEGFDKWRAANKDKWDSFLKWFSENGLEVNDTNKYYSEQY